MFQHNGFVLNWVKFQRHQNQNSRTSNGIDLAEKASGAIVTARGPLQTHLSHITQVLLGTLMYLVQFWSHLVSTWRMKWTTSRSLKIETLKRKRQRLLKSSIADFNERKSQRDMEKFAAKVFESIGVQLYCAVQLYYSNN